MRAVLKPSILHRVLAVVSLWLLLAASAFASGGPDCPGHGFKSKFHPTSALDLNGLYALAEPVASAQAVPPQHAVNSAALSENPPIISAADDACGSCIHCAACCFSVAPPLTLTLAVLPPSAGTVISPSVPHHRSPDLAALERPPHAAKNLKTA